MKVTKQQKDLNPKLYGYGSVVQLEADLTRFGDDPDNSLTHWVAFKDGDDHLRFVPCTEEYFHMHRNENRNEQRREQRWRSQTPVSLDALREDYEFEFSDPSYELDKESEEENRLKECMWLLIDELKESDQTILKLFNKGYSDREIGEILNKARSTIQEKRIKLIEELKEKMKKFE